MKTSDLVAGKVYHRPSSVYYYRILAIGHGDIPVYQSFTKADNNYQETGRLAGTLHDWQEYDPTPEVSHFYNVYLNLNAASTEIGNRFFSLEKAQQSRGVSPCLGTMEVVSKGDQRVKTIWHGDV